MILQELYPYETAAQDETARLHPWNPELDLRPGTWKGLPTGVGMGLMRGGAKVAEAGALAASTLMFGDTKDEWFKTMVDPAAHAVDYWTPGPRDVGKAGQILGGLAEIAAPLALSGGNPALLMGTQALTTGKEMVDQGVDAGTAGDIGFVSALATGIGFRLPMFGSTLARKLLFGGVSNVALGAGSDVLAAQELKDRGYAEIAKQFNPTDFERRAVEFLMGAVFGGIAHATTPKGAETPSLRDAAFGPADPNHPIARFVRDMIPDDIGTPDAVRTVRQGMMRRLDVLQRQAADMPPSQRQALLTAANMQHFELDTAPGKITSLTALHQHVTALEQAITQIARGEPVTASADPKLFPADPRVVDWKRQLGSEVDAIRTELGLTIKAPETVQERRTPPPATDTAATGAALEPAKPIERSVADIHALADSLGVQWDNDPKFAALTKEITGKEHLDALTPAERGQVYDRLQSDAAPAPNERSSTAPGDTTGFAPAAARILHAADEAMTAARDIQIPTGARDANGDAVTMPAHQALAEADAEIAKAEGDAHAYTVAANCMLRTV